eukprot:s322_g7.t1
MQWPAAQDGIGGEYLPNHQGLYGRQHAVESAGVHRVDLLRHREFSREGSSASGLTELDEKIHSASCVGDATSALAIGSLSTFPTTPVAPPPGLEASVEFELANESPSKDRPTRLVEYLEHIGGRQRANDSRDILAALRAKNRHAGPMALLANPVEWTEDAHNGKLQASPSADSPVLYRVREPLEAASSTLLHQLWPPTGLRGGVFRPSGFEDSVELQGRVLWPRLLSWQAAVSTDAMSKMIEEVVRYGGCELHTTSSVLGGITSQEVVKLVTKQYSPFCNTLLYDGLQGKMQVLEM